MTTQTKVKKKDAGAVLKQLAQSSGSDWVCVLEAGTMEYLPALIHSIDFKPIKPTGEENVHFEGQIMYGREPIGYVKIVISKSKIGTIDVFVDGVIQLKLDGVTSEPKPEKFDLNQMY